MNARRLARRGVGVVTVLAAMWALVTVMCRFNEHGDPRMSWSQAAGESVYVCALTLAILATDGFEQVELTDPKQAVEQAGAKTRLLSLKDGEIQGMHHDKPGDRFKVDGRVADAKIDDYDGLILPGGVANPDNLRADADAVKFVQDFFATGKPVYRFVTRRLLKWEDNEGQGPKP